MKKLLSFIVMAFVTLFMSGNVALGQDIQDKDPGYIYLMYHKTAPSTFKEGDGWEITFSGTDTLGNVYERPTIITITGGALADSIGRAIEDIDSLVWYQPKPVLQDSVYEITREHFQYIVSVDSTTAIHFSKDIEGIIELPVVGSHVICDIEEDPLPIGFIGIVSSMDREGDEIVMRCDTPWTSLIPFYKKLLHTSSSINDEDLPGSSKNLRRKSAQRNDGEVKDTGKTMCKDLNVYFDHHLPLKFSSSFSNGAKVGGVTISGSLKIGLDGDFYWSDSETTCVDASAEEEYSTCKIDFYTNTTVNFDATLTAKSKIPIYAIPPIATAFKFGSINVSLGLYANLTASLTFGGVSNIRVRKSFNMFEDTDSDGKSADVMSTTTSLVKVGVSGSASVDLEASIKVRAGSTKETKNEETGKLESTDKSGINGSGEVSATLSFVKLSGELNFTAEVYENVDTPQDLITNYQTKEKYANSKLSIEFLKFSLKLACDASITFDKEGNKKWSLIAFEKSFNFGPAFGPFTTDGFFPTWNNSLKEVRSSATTRTYQLGLSTKTRSLFAYKISAWAWHELDKYFYKKVDTDVRGGFFLNTKNEFKPEIELEKGFEYSIMHVLDDTWSPQVDHKIFVPYEMKMKPVSEAYCVELYSTIDQLAVDHNKSHRRDVSCGIEYNKKSLGFDRNPIRKDLTLSSEFGFTTPELESNETYVARSWAKVGGDEGWTTIYSDTIEFKTPDWYTPIMYSCKQEYDQAKFTASVTNALERAYREKTHDVNYGFYVGPSKVFTTNDVYMHSDGYFVFSDTEPKYSGVLANLHPDQKYYVQPVTWVNNIVHCSSNQIWSFDTKNPFNVKTEDVLDEDITMDHAVLAGSFEDDHALDFVNTEYFKRVYFKIASAEDWKNGVGIETYTVSVNSSDLMTTFEKTVGGLQEGYDYVYQFYFDSDVKTYPGGEKKFTAKSRIHGCETLDPVKTDEKITFRMKASEFFIMDPRFLHNVEFYYARNKDDLDKSDCKHVTGKADGNGFYTADITTLTAGVTYNCRAVVTVEMDYGVVVKQLNTVTFKTPNPFETTTGDTSNPSNDKWSTSFNGTITQKIVDMYKNNEGNVVAYFEYSTEKSALDGECDKAYATISSTSVTVTPKLLYNTKYYYRLVSEVNGVTYKGSIKECTTCDILYCETRDATATEECVTIKGWICPEAAYTSTTTTTNSLGQKEKIHNVTAYIDYSKEDGMRSPTSVAVEFDTTTGEFSKDIYTMDYDTTYYYRTRLVIDGQEVKGELKSVKTLEYDPGQIVDKNKKR